jgi:predicted acylesterase/phospholipase RssA
MKRLVFAGGGARCISFFHAMAALDPALLVDVTEWWGTSAGSLVAALLSVKGDISMMTHLSAGIDFRQFRNMELDHIFNITRTWGLDSGDGLLEGISCMLEQVGAKDWTLSKVPGLHIIIADVTHSKTIICSSKTHPDLLLAHAVRASMSLPFFYMPYRTPDGSLWVDGGIRCNFAWTLLSEEEQRESIGFFFGTPQSGPIGQTPTTLSQYLLRLIHFDEKTELEGNLVRVHIPNFPAWFVNLQEEDRVELASCGRAAGEVFMKEWLARSSGTPPDLVSTSHPSPAPSSLVHPLSETSDIPIHSLPSLYPGLHHNPPLKLLQLNRRWSV